MRTCAAVRPDGPAPEPGGGVAEEMVGGSHSAPEQGRLQGRGIARLPRVCAVHCSSLGSQALAGQCRGRAPLALGQVLVDAKCRAGEGLRQAREIHRKSTVWKPGRGVTHLSPLSLLWQFTQSFLLSTRHYYGRFDITMTVFWLEMNPQSSLHSLPLENTC